jgi:hypothetical protein
MKCAVEMGEGVMINIRTFIEIALSIQKLMGEGGHTDRQDGDRISQFSFLKNKESRLKTDELPEIQVGHTSNDFVFSSLVVSSIAENYKFADVGNLLDLLRN